MWIIEYRNERVLPIYVGFRRLCWVGSVFASIFKQISDRSCPSKIHRFLGFDLCGIEPGLVPERERGQDFGEGRMNGNILALNS